MFAIQRFDGSAALPQRADDTSGLQQASSSSSKLDRRIALLNQRHAEAAAAKASEEVKVAAAGATGLKIHPSRLAASHVLRQSDKKARSSLNGTAKEKTKAKQRYLNRKKDRRKKRKVVTALTSAAKRRRDGATDVVKVVEPDAIDGEDAEQETSGTDDSGSSSESEMDTAGEETAIGLNTSEPVIEAAVVEERVRYTVDTEDIAMSEERTRSPVPFVQAAQEKAALMRLPAAQSTSQASKRDLAAQGLPEGLANPTVVDAAHTATLVSRSAQQTVDRVSESTRAQLAKLGIESWFAVQTAIIPKLLDHPAAYELYPYRPPGDLCVSAPTGSGKTLSYVVPIVEVLRRRVCRRVRALVLLPTRDLVHQVRETLEAVAKGTGLTIASVTGQQSFAHEQSMLVDAPPMLLSRNIPGLLAPVPGSEEETALFESNYDAAIAAQADSSKHLTIESNVDIVIATPGRLIDHMDQTPGFTLQHLRFLVIDEADRLLSQSFQEWLPRILEALDPRARDGQRTALDQSRFEAALNPAWLLEKRLRRVDEQRYPVGAAAFLQRRENCTQKLLFSATLTRDPAKIVALQLRDASFISVEDTTDAVAEREDSNWQDSFALPATLSEHLLVTSTSNKPLDLLYLLYLRAPEPLRQVLCFTKSVESATRLVKLLEFFDQSWRSLASNAGAKPLVVREHSSELRGILRSTLLSDIKSGLVDVVVCSDVIARGIDLPAVRHVVSYDAPVEMAKHVHRVGRTARANRQGDAWTLVEEQEARHFLQMMQRGGRKEKLDRVRLPKAFRHLSSATPQEDDSPNARVHAAYRHALERLGEHFSSSRKRV